MPTAVDITAPGSAPPGVLPGAAVPEEQPRPSRRQRTRRRRAHRRLAWSLVVLLVLLLVGGGWLAARRINRPLAQPMSHSGLSSAQAVTGSLPSLPWPAKGQGAVAVPSLDYAQQSGPESSVPIASLTKMTNAVVVLHDHPVPAGTSGPMITITAADVAEYDSELHNDESSIAIRVGEVLSERQMLEALLTQSANDIAYSLALWDAGTEPAFVVKMNAMAASLGATSSRYVDASGYNPLSVSTAADCLRIASAGMRDPTFAEVVAMPSVTLPLVGTLPNIVSEIGSNGVVGVKSGYTSYAGGCLVLAGKRMVQGRPVLVLVAVLSQPVPPPIIPKSTTTTRPAPASTAPPTTAAPTPTTPTTAAPPGSTAPPATAVPPTTAVPPATAAPPTTAAPPRTTPSTSIPLNDLQVPDPLRYTRPVTEALLTASENAVVRVAVATAGQVVGAVTVTWGGSAHPVPMVTGRGAWLLAWPGQSVVSASELSPVPPGSTKGSRVGTALFSLGTQIASVPLRLANTVPEPSWWWRLVHSR